MVKNKVIRQANDGGNTWIDCSLEAFNRAKENGIPVREVCLREESLSHLGKPGRLSHHEQSW
jgi:hypothetical protein